MFKYFPRVGFSIVLIVSGLAVNSCVAWANVIAIPTAPVTHAKDFYPWITFLTEGPTDWFALDENASVQGKAYRLVITTSEIYNTIYIEMVTYGSEGCCKKINNVKKFDLDTFSSAFNFGGEQSGFIFDHWLNATSFVFLYKDRKFTMSDIGQDSIHVAPYSGN